MIRVIEKYFLKQEKIKLWKDIDEPFSYLAWKQNESSIPKIDISL